MTAQHKDFDPVDGEPYAGIWYDSKKNTFPWYCVETNDRWSLFDSFNEALTKVGPQIGTNLSFYIDSTILDVNLIIPKEML